MARMQTSPSSQTITCQVCRQRVPLTFLDGHHCNSPRTIGLKERLEGIAAGRDTRRGHKPAAIDTGSSWRSERRPGLSPSGSYGSLAQTPSLSPSYTSSLSQSTSQSSDLSLSSSFSSLNSPASANSPLSAKLPFFDKYNKVYGENTQSPTPLTTSFSSRSLNTYDRTPPKISVSRDYPGSGPNGLNTQSSRGADGRVLAPRSAGLPREPSRLNNFRSRSDDGLNPSKRSPGFKREDRPIDNGETIGRAFLEDSPYIPDCSTFESGLSYLPPEATVRPRKTSGTSAKILAADALDSLLEDLSVEASEKNGRGPVESYYFGITDQDEDTMPTPRASAAAVMPKTHYALRSKQPLPPPHASPTRSAHSAPAPRPPPKALLKCRHCKKQVTGRDSVERDGGRFCAACYADRYLPKCRKCRLPIEGSAISSGDGKVKGKFHTDCFNCFACSAPFPNKEFYVFDERPYCSHDYHKLAGSLCKTCGTGIEGHCVTLDADLGGRRFHPSCFTCSHPACAVLLTDFHFVVDGLPFCERHAERRALDQGRRAEKRKTLVRPHVHRRV